MIVNTCPQILLVVSCKPYEAELRPLVTACPDLKVFPERWLGLACRYLCRPQQRRDGTLRPGTHTAWRPALQLHIKYQLCCPCQMLSEIIFTFWRSFSFALPDEGMQQLGDLIMRKKVPGELLGRERDHHSSVQNGEMSLTAPVVKTKWSANSIRFFWLD